jgi:hypothetical protein
VRTRAQGNHTFPLQVALKTIGQNTPRTTRRARNARPREGKRFLAGSKVMHQEQPGDRLINRTSTRWDG